MADTAGFPRAAPRSAFVRGAPVKRVQGCSIPRLPVLARARAIPRRAWTQCECRHVHKQALPAVCEHLAGPQWASQAGLPENGAGLRKRRCLMAPCVARRRAIASSQHWSSRSLRSRPSGARPSTASGRRPTRPSTPRRGTFYRKRARPTNTRCTACSRCRRRYVHSRTRTSSRWHNYMMQA